MTYRQADPATVRSEVLGALHRGTRTARGIARLTGYAERVIRAVLAELAASGDYLPPKRGRPLFQRVDVLPGETVQQVMARTGADLYVAQKSVALVRPPGARVRCVRSVAAVETSIAFEVNRHTRAMAALAWELEGAKRRQK